MVLPSDLRRALTLKTAPAFDTAAQATCVVALADAKRQCNAQEFTDDDDLIKGLIASATAHLDGADGVLQRALLDQQWELRLDCFPPQLRIPLPPIKTVESITYVDSAGVTQTLASTEYQLVKNGQQTAFIVPAFGKCWPSHQAVYDAICVTFTAGYGDGSKVPAPIAHAAKLLIAHWYDNRDAMIVSERGAAVNIPKGFEALISPYVASWF